MQRFVLLTSKHNRYYDRFVGVFRRLGVDSSCYYYEDFSYSSGEWNYGDVRFDGFGGSDVVYMRDGGYIANEELFALYRKFGKMAIDSGATVLDGDIWSTFPDMIDKKFQAEQYDKNGIPHVKTVLLSEVGEDWVDYPAILKPRVGAGGKGTQVVDSYERMIDYRKEVNAEKHICQPFRRVVRDLRVMIVGGKVLGAIRRDVIRHEDGHVGVKSQEDVELNDEEKRIVGRFVEDDRIFIRGIDLLTDDIGYTWVGEVNVSPIFSAFERLTKIDVVERIVRAMIVCGVMK